MDANSLFRKLLDFYSKIGQIFEEVRIRDGYRFSCVNCSIPCHHPCYCKGHHHPVVVPAVNYCSLKFTSDDGQTVLLFFKFDSKLWKFGCKGTKSVSFFISDMFCIFDPADPVSNCSQNSDCRDKIRGCPGIKGDCL